MDKYYLVIFKRQEGQEFNSYSFVDSKALADLKKQKAVEEAIEAPRKTIYSKDDIRELLATSTNAQIKVDLE